MVLKLFRCVERDDNQTTAQTELVAAMRQTTELPVSGCCITDCRAFLMVSFFASRQEEKISDIFFPEKKGHAILRIRGIASINKGH